MSSLRRGHANLLCIVPILVYVLPKRAPNYLIVFNIKQHVASPWESANCALPDRHKFLIQLVHSNTTTLTLKSRTVRAAATVETESWPHTRPGVSGWRHLPCNSTWFHPNPWRWRRQASPGLTKQLSERATPPSAAPQLAQEEKKKHVCVCEEAGVPCTSWWEGNLLKSKLNHLLFSFG